MIHSKLKKGKASELLVQFSRNVQQWPSVIKKFLSTCMEESVKISKSSNLLPEIIRFYTINEQTIGNQFKGNNSHPQFKEQVYKSRVQQVNLEFTIIYINDENYQIPNFRSFQSIQNENPRVLLVRQNLDPFYHLEFQVQNTMSQNQSVIYLCELSAMIINSKYEKQLLEHQKKKQKMIRKGNQGQMSQVEVIWRNILFQMPGIGKDKCKVIANKFPTYQHILKDSKKNKTLKNLDVSKGIKSTKLGSVHAQRIYKVFCSLDPEEKLY